MAGRANKPDDPEESRHFARDICGPVAFLIGRFCEHTRLCLPFLKSQRCESSIVETWVPESGFGATGMLRRGVTSEAKCALIRRAKGRPDVCGKGAASAHWHGLSRPCTHDEGSACPSTLPNRPPVGCAPGPSRPGPGPMGALLPRNPQRQDFRVPTPTASVSPLDQDERCRRSIYGW